MKKVSVSVCGCLMRWVICVLNISPHTKCTIDFEQIQECLDRSMSLLPGLLNLTTISLAAQATACDTLMKLGNLHITKHFVAHGLSDTVAEMLVNTSEHIFQMSKESMTGNNVSSAQTTFIDCCTSIQRTVCNPLAAMPDALFV